MDLTQLPRVSTLTAAQIQQIVAADDVRDYVRYVTCSMDRNGRSQSPFAAVLDFKDRWPDAVKSLAARWPETRQGELLRKAAVTAGASTDAAWAGPLVSPDGFATVFLNATRPLLLTSQLRLQKVPFNTPVTIQSVFSTATWTAEGLPKPGSQAGHTTVTLARAKVADWTTVTDEVVKLAVAGAEEALRNDLVSAVVTLVNATFCGTAAPSAGSPGGIANGVTPIAPSGTTGAALVKDLSVLISQALSNNPDASRLSLVMTGGIASMLRTASATPETLTADQGGYYCGLPVIVSPYAGTSILAINGAAVAYADAGLELGLSKHASPQLDTAPVGTAAMVPVSFWQSDYIGLRAEIHTNWKKGRTSAVSAISPTAYQPGS